MRKIEQQLIAAIKAGKPFNKDNTSLSVIPQTDEEWWSVKLYDNEIARVYRPNGLVEKIGISHCGWLTTTTKSRLNAIIQTFCSSGCSGVYQKKGNWFIAFKLKRIEKIIPFETGFYQIFAD